MITENTRKLFQSVDKGFGCIFDYIYLTKEEIEELGLDINKCYHDERGDGTLYMCLYKLYFQHDVGFFPNDTH